MRSGLTAQGRSAFGSAAALEEALEEATRRAAEAAALRDALLQSTSWRLTAPVRKVAASIPLAWRSHLRQAAKIAWWVATPWRTPQRVRFLRERARETEEAPPPEASRSDAGYAEWIAANESSLSANPGPGNGARFSLLLAAGSDADALGRTLDSLRSQTYANWELVLAAAGDVPGAIQLQPDADGLQLVRVAAGNDDRAECLAACAAKASGAFIGMLEAGDILVPHALAEVAHALRNAPESDILYSDEDELDAEGLRQKPYFKPGWSPDLLYAFNYFGRLTFLRRELVLAARGVDASTGAGVEWDLNLRVSERAHAVTRIPKVLCHRRPGSDRDRSAGGSGAAREQASVLQGFWARRGVDTQVQTQPDGTQRTIWSSETPPLVSIVIPTKDKVDLLRMCVEGLLRRTSYPNKQIVIVDTGSTEPATMSYYEELRGHAEILIVHFRKKFNYSAACNHGASFARGELLLFLNNDIEVISSDWLQEMVGFAMRPGVGVVGTKLVYPSRELQHGGVAIGVHLCGLMYRSAENEGWGLFGSPDHPRNWLAIMGACQLVRRDAFDRVGGFDESYLVAMSDVALCLQVWRAGYRIAYAPHACLVHHEGATRGHSNPTLDVRRIADDIRSLGIDEDPYLHPELDGMAAIPALRVGAKPTVRETLKADILAFGSPLMLAPLLDLTSDGVCVETAALPRDRVLWTPQPAHAVSDLWSAARWVLDLLRTRSDLRTRFPTALSDGADGAFARWLYAEGGAQFGLPASAAPALRELLSGDISERARQAFLFDEEIRRRLPNGLLPSGRYELFYWFMQRGRLDAGLRLEEIWWLFWRAAERPVRELLIAHAFTPAWQALYPDGATVFGKKAFAAWFVATYREMGDWIDPSQWQIDLPPAIQLRTAFLAREQWQLAFPRALEDAVQAVGLIDWLRSPGARQPPEVRDWCGAIDEQAVAAELVTRGVNIIGHFAYPSGLRVSVEAMVEGLHRAGVRTSLRDVRTDRKDDPIHAGFRGFEDFDTTIIHAQPEPFFDNAYDRADLSESSPRTYRIAYWYWEFDTIPDAWVAHARGVDEVWTATEFVAKGLREKLSVPVRTMFPGVKLAPYERRSKAYFGLSEEPFTFLFTFHMMSVMERKNPLGLIRAFKAAFREEEAVRLVLKTSFGDRHPAQIQELREAAAGANIIIIDQVYSPDEVLSLMDTCDAYVSLHRSEGLGLTMAEAMLMGKPVIATNFSGNVDFMDDSNSLLVPYKLVKLGKPIPPYDAGLEWAEPSEQHAAELMRRVYDNQAWAKGVGARGKASAEANLSLEAAGRRIAARLEEIKTLRRAARPMSQAA